MTGVGTLVLVTVVAALAGAGLTAAVLRRAERRRWRWLDQRAAERVGCWWAATGGDRELKHTTCVSRVIRRMLPP